MRHRRFHRTKRHNPAAAKPFKALTAGFQPKHIMEALPITGGVFLNYMIRQQIESKFPTTKPTGTGFPFLLTAIGLTTAGLMLLVPKFGPKLFIGGITEETLRVISYLTTTKFLAGEDESLMDYAQLTGESLHMPELTLQDYEMGDYEMGDYAKSTATQAMEQEPGF